MPKNSQEKQENPTDRYFSYTQEPLDPNLRKSDAVNITNQLSERRGYIKLDETKFNEILFLIILLLIIVAYLLYKYVF